MVFSKGNLGKYLDENGLNYLINQLEDKFASDGGNVDLSDYYTKEEIDTIIDGIPNSGGSDGVGVQSVQLVNYELIITLTDNTVYNLGNVRGEQGIQGADGQSGLDGIDGISPTIAVTNITDGYNVAITDVNGTQSFDVLNGKDGTTGSGGGGDSNIYSTDEVEIGTWIDGSPIYRKVVELGKLESVSSGNYQLKNIDISTDILKFIDIKGVMQYGVTTVIAYPSFSNVQFNPSTTHNTYIAEVEKGKITLIGSGNRVQLYYGSSWSSYNCSIIAEYIKKN